MSTEVQHLAEAAKGLSEAGRDALTGALVRLRDENAKRPDATSQTLAAMYAVALVGLAEATAEARETDRRLKQIARGLSG